MSMIGHFIAVSESQLKQFIRDPDVIVKFIYPDGNVKIEAPSLYIDKAWHGIHFLLTGVEADGDPPLAWAVMGATEIGEDVGYGPARYLTASQVKEVSEALSKISREDLEQRFDPASLTDHGIYPDIWDEDQGAFDYLATYYESMQKFYREAANKGQAMLVYLN